MGIGDYVKRDGDRDGIITRYRIIDRNFSFAVQLCIASHCSMHACCFESPDSPECYAHV